jgi:hypothetical protein
VIDGDLLYVLDRARGKSAMYEMGATELAEIPATDPRAARLSAYRAEAELFTGWATWRHLARAEALKSDGGGSTHAVSTEAAQARHASDAIAPPPLVVHPPH